MNKKTIAIIVVLLAVAGVAIVEFLVPYIEEKKAAAAAAAAKNKKIFGDAPKSSSANLGGRGGAISGALSFVNSILPYENRLQNALKEYSTAVKQLNGMGDLPDYVKIDILKRYGITNSAQVADALNYLTPAFASLN